jgi:hypothetical protein
MLLSGLLLFTAFGFQAVDAKTDKEIQQIEKTRTSILRRGLGRDARVEVKLRDNTKLKGYITQAGEDSFTVVDSKTGASSTIAYANVAQVKGQGNGLSTRTKIIIGAAVAAGAAIVLYTVRGAFCDGMC